MLRPIILALSQSRLAERAATTFPGVSSFSQRFVAGNTRDAVVDAVRRLNGEGYDATVSFLGEAVATEAEVQAALAEFMAFADAVHDLGLRSHLWIKLTELGLAFDRELAARSLDAVVRHAHACGTFVRIDMEDSRYTQVTLDLFRGARRSHANTGIVVQAYLRRSDGDIAALANEGAPVRLVKGAYREPESVAWQEKDEVDAAFVRLADAYFGAITEGGWLAVATHDARMIRAAIAAAERAGVGRDRFEFQMLYGIRGDLQRRLRDEGYRVRVYVPYGSHWYPYMMRRLAERPANLWFFLRSAFR